MFQEYIQDGIDWAKVDFEDNQDCLNLFEKVLTDPFSFEVQSVGFIFLIVNISIRKILCHSFPFQFMQDNQSRTQFTVHYRIHSCFWLSHKILWKTDYSFSRIKRIGFLYSMNIEAHFPALLGQIFICYLERKHIFCTHVRYRWAFYCYPVQCSLFFEFTS